MSPTVTEQPPAAAAPEQEAPARKDGQARAGTKAPWQIVPINVEQIGPSPYQPRLTFDPSETAELVASVKERGVQQPILVRTAKSKTQAESQENGAAGNGKNGNGHAPKRPHGEKRLRYELIAGERRLRACKEAGRRHIPAIIRDDLSDCECAELALLENVQRSNLSVVEEARGYKQLMLKFGMKEERIARKVGKSVQTIQAMLRLLQLPELVQHLLSQKKLSASHGQELLALAPFERVCTLVAQHAVDNRVTALSLAANPLPNALDLKRKGLLEELDYKTKFDWRSACESCPHKAFLKSGYASYCLKPEEWKRKQEAAITQQKDEATRAMQQVREQIREQEQDGQVDTSALPTGSYRNLSVMQVPAGCGEHCPCRRETCYPGAPDAPVPICVDPARLKELQDAQRLAHEDARRRHFTRLWEQANQVLEGEKDEPRRAAALLTSTILGTELHRYGYDAEHGALARSVARAVGLVLPWDGLLEAEDEAAMFNLLGGNSPEETDGAEGASAQATEPPEPGQLLLFAASLLLVQEVRSAVRFGGETPRLGFVLGPQHEAQLELPSRGGTPDGEELPPHDPADEDQDPFAHEHPDPLEEEPFEDEPFDEQPENDSDL
jgi:ParB family chromosome partitioning protein